MQKFNILIMGGGIIGRRHMELLAANKRTSIAGLADPFFGAAEVAKKFGIPYFATLDDAAAKTSVDGVIIATPNNLHGEHVIDCVQRGWPALVEKPVASTLEDA